jgi:hypothetical protein
LPAKAQTSPADIPALFARAWNGRDPAALAVLFDEDAEFVSVEDRSNVVGHPNYPSDQPS